MRSTPPSKRSAHSNALSYQQSTIDLLPAGLNRDQVSVEKISSELGAFYHRASRKWIKVVATCDHVTPAAPSLMGLDKIRFCNDLPYPDGKTYVNRLNIQSDRITVYREYQEDFQRTEAQRSTERNLTRGKYNGFISPQSARKVRKILDAWFQAIHTNAEFYRGKHRPKHSRITFATLTLPATQQHDDREIKRKCLQPFIQQLQRVCSVDQWFWKAEPQETRNIHFHLLLDRYVAKDQLDSLWFAAVDRLGYIDRYAAKFGAGIPPMCEIHVCPPDTTLINYVMKYVSKAPVRIPSFKLEDGKRVKTSRHWIYKKDKLGSMRWCEWRPISGRVWGMSDQLRSIESISWQMTYRMEDLLVCLDWFPEVRRFDVDHAVVYFCDVVKLLKRVDQKLYINYRNHHLQVYRSLYLDAGAVSGSPP